MANNSIRVGFVSFYFPNLFQNQWTKKLSGIYSDIWNDFAQITSSHIDYCARNDYGGYLPESCGVYAGMLGDIQTGDLIGRVDAYSSQPERIPYFRVSREVDYTTESFYESHSLTFWPYITQFVIFDHWTYLSSDICHDDYPSNHVHNNPSSINQTLTMDEFFRSSILSRFLLCSQDYLRCSIQCNNSTSNSEC
ncbi:hypothetical protein PFISCL1PPCAC_14778 [Pristionchus fissidentatus]|uniref:Uncharacterized protein n=1 Tax=Pristionchus fissidentatus TaxID=1538716 RepID=A0AAV5VY88_9BILA|nr:hypothetical protein PFISCL1PPCAC_14778 [Pristionchus fissidentatus]